ncbi:hypothetical protein FQN60_012316 [Etheostoma spectabile]|uniref:IF rod domain-containing protein n=1 Tax=Etheostoma spectabile TaxID=54343 RepID=A0A5J5DPH6_9PERO|nr:hypothetical protein FQN60_012316 [Etheostoma spectabile]
MSKYSENQRIILQIDNAQMAADDFKINLSFKTEKRLLNVQQAGMVNVEVDSKQSVDLTLVLQEIREQYEAMVVKNKQELEKWFQSKVELLNTQITTCTTEVKTFSTQLSELKKTLQTVEINRESLLKEVVEVQVEEHKPHIERRVKTIVEEIIDGKVVSSSVDTQVQEIQ